MGQAGPVPRSPCAPESCVQPSTPPVAKPANRSEKHTPLASLRYVPGLLTAPLFVQVGWKIKRLVAHGSEIELEARGESAFARQLGIEVQRVELIITVGDIQQRQLNLRPASGEAITGGDIVLPEI